MHVLSQISVEAMGPITTWIVGASGTMFLLNQALTFWKTHVLNSAGYATKGELKEAHGRISRERKEIDTLIAEMKTRHDVETAALRSQLITNNSNGEARAEKIHDRINLLVEDNANMPTRVVELLRATKGLIG